jgi:hypothetical protein
VERSFLYSKVSVIDRNIYFSPPHFLYCLHHLFFSSSFLILPSPGIRQDDRRHFFCGQGIMIQGKDWANV